MGIAAHILWNETINLGPVSNTFRTPSTIIIPMWNEYDAPVAALISRISVKEHFTPDSG